MFEMKSRKKHFRAADDQRIDVADMIFILIFVIHLIQHGTDRIDAAAALVFVANDKPGRVGRVGCVEDG